MILYIDILERIYSNLKGEREKILSEVILNKSRNIECKPKLPEKKEKKIVSVKL